MENSDWQDIVPFTAQDEICNELWEVLQACKARTLGLIGEVQHDGRDGGFTQELQDMIFLTSYAGDSYRYHAEKLPKHYGLGAVLAATTK